MHTTNAYVIESDLKSSFFLVLLLGKTNLTFLRRKAKKLQTNPKNQIFWESLQLLGIQLRGWFESLFDWLWGNTETLWFAKKFSVSCF